MVFANESATTAIVNEINIHPSFIRSTYTVYKRQILRLISNKTQLVFVLLMPIMWIGIIGTTFNNILPVGMLAPGENYLTFMTPGILIMVTLFSGIFGGISLFYDRDSGYLKNYLIAPSPRTAIVTGYALGTSTRVVIQDIILLGVAILLGVNIDLSLQNLAVIFIFAILTTNFLMGLSITLAAKAPNVEVFQSIITPIVMPLNFLAPIMYPVSYMPQVFQFIAKINPITFGADGIRGTLQGVATTSPIINNTFYRNNIVMIDMLFLLIAGAILLYTGSRLFLKSLAG